MGPGFFPGPEDADDGGGCGRPGGPPGLLFGPLGGCGGGKACTFVFVARFLSPSFCWWNCFFRWRLLLLLLMTKRAGCARHHRNRGRRHDVMLFNSFLFLLFNTIHARVVVQAPNKS